jgi:hypothetical protein
MAWRLEERTTLVEENSAVPVVALVLSLADRELDIVEGAVRSEKGRRR